LEREILLTLLATIVLLGSLPVIQCFRKGRAKRPLPGPFSLPWLGSIFSMPGRYDWSAIAGLGEITFMRVLGLDILYINSQEIAMHLLDKKGAIYSDRPELEFAGKL
jgi:hypothetical protein